MTPLFKLVLYGIMVIILPACYHKMGRSVIGAKVDTESAAPVWQPAAGRLRDTVSGRLRYIEYPDTPRHNVDCQLGGPALGFSVNYERRLVGKKNEFDIRAGLGISGGDSATHSRTFLMLPILAVYRLGNHRNHVELGAGATFLHAGTFPPNQHYHISSFNGIDVPGVHRDIAIITASLGYRIPIFLPTNNDENHLGRTNDYISFGLSYFYAFSQTGFSFYFSYGLTF